MIPWLGDACTFPDPARALRDPNGLLCAGGDLSAPRLLAAYRRGIFPWYSDETPILWWSPDPRMVLFPREFRITRSLRRTLRSRRFTIRLDTAFAEVIRACAETPRRGQPGTWITQEIQEAYCRLHELGHAHSVEAWRDGRLVGGLYGIAIGRMYYGESMFALESDASKVAAAHLARFLDEKGFAMIDCQMSTPHLASLGARELARGEFLERLRELTAADLQPARWPADGADFDWH